jgi:hypothetical protein
MRDHDRDTQKDGAQGQPPQKSKVGSEQDRALKHAEAHPATHTDILRDERVAAPANAEPLAGLLSQLQQSHGNAYVQRVVSEAGGEKAHEQKHAAESHTHSGAQPIDAGTRSQMESAFGESFGDVHVHTGKEAGAVSEQLGARAFTSGRDIYFKEGEYNPSTREGQELLAHELTHVVQQRGGTSARGASVGPAGDTFEQEAEDVAALVMRGERAHVEQRSAASDVQRDPLKGPQPQTITAWLPMMLKPNETEQHLFPDFSVQLHLASVEGASFDTLHVTVPILVSATVVDLSGMGMQVQDPGGHAARVIVIRVNRKAQGRMLQITFSKGSRVEIATYVLPTVSPAAAVTASAAAGEAGKKH